MCSWTNPTTQNITTCSSFPLSFLLVSFSLRDISGKCFVAGCGRGNARGHSNENYSNDSCFKFLKGKEGTANTQVYHQMDCVFKHTFLSVEK